MQPWVAAVMGAGGGAQSTAKRETINADGDEGACEKSAPDDKAPPANCGAMLRVEVVPLVGVVLRGPSSYTGTWTWTCCGGMYHGTLVLQQQGDKVTGSVSDMVAGETDPLAGGVTSEGLVFVRTLNGQRWVFKGPGESLKGTIDGGDHSADVEMTRVPGSQ